jgi:hypothetical protein
MVPNPARKTAAARVRQAEAAARAAETARDAALLQLRSPAPGQAAYLTNQVINALAAPVEAACLELEDADSGAASVPARVPLGALSPDMVRLDAEVKQITHAVLCVPKTCATWAYALQLAVSLIPRLAPGG